MLVIYFGRDLTEGFTLILAVKMKVHKLLYFYWSLHLYSLSNEGGWRGGIRRGLNDHRLHVGERARVEAGSVAAAATLPSIA